MCQKQSIFLPCPENKAGLFIIAKLPCISKIAINGTFECGFDPVIQVLES